MIPVAEARRRLLDAVTPRGPESVDLGEALGRTLAETVTADRDLPAADTSAMDGYALRAADAAAAATRLRVAGEVRAGQDPGDRRLGPGEAVRIFTGGLLPPGADAVVMVEITREDPGTGTVEILERPEPGQHVRRRGEDVRSGAEVLRPGTVVRAAEVAALAAFGRTRVRVVGRPRVRVLSTGEEVVPEDSRPLTHQVRNSNTPCLLAALGELGFAGEAGEIVPDHRPELERCLAWGLEADLLLVTGGVSVGAYDLVRPALEALGTRVLFHGVAMRPGKPVLAGSRGASIVVALPGNPVSAFTGFAVLVAPALRKMSGREPVEWPPLRVALEADLDCRPGRTTFHLAAVRVADGRLLARPIRAMGSGDVVSLTRANAFVVTEGAATALAAGVEVDAFLWRLA